MKTITTLTALALLATAATQASAASYTANTYTYEFDLTLIDSTADDTPETASHQKSFALAAFDDTLGTLTGAQLTIMSGFAANWNLGENGGDAAGAYNSQMLTYMGGDILMGVGLDGTATCSSSAPIEDQCPFSNFNSISDTAPTLAFTAAEWMSKYSAAQSLVMDFQAITNLAAGSSGTSDLFFQSFDGGVPEETWLWGAQLVYSYETAAVPLPAAGWMLIAGLGGMAALRRRRRG